jgi:hypothetical protein
MGCLNQVTPPFLVTGSLFFKERAIILLWKFSSKIQNPRGGLFDFLNYEKNLQILKKKLE